MPVLNKMSDLRLYTPHANQRLVHESKAKYRVVVAGRRFGKSALGLNEALARAFQLKNQIIWIILPLQKQAREIYWVDPDVVKYFMPYVNAGLIKINNSELSLKVLSTGSWIRLKGSDNFESLRGSGIDLIVWDEVADIKERAFEVILPALADSPNHRMLYIGTPKGLNFFHDFALQGDHNHIIPSVEKPINLKSDWMTWHFTSYDNLAWLEGSSERQTFISFINLQKAEAEEKGKLSFFNQEYMGSFEESAGRFFPRWFYKTHVTKPIEPNPIYTIFGTIDWGRSAPMCWLAHVVIPMNFEGIKFNRVITFKEVYGSGKSPFEQAQLITGDSKNGILGAINYTTIKKTYYDPSMDTPQSDGSMSVADQFRRSFEQLTGERPQMTPASNKRVSRWAAVENWMRQAPDGLPFWLVSENCINLIRTIPLMRPDPNNIEDLNTTLEDHGIDSAAYGLQYVTWVDTGKVGSVVYKPPIIQYQPKLWIPTTLGGNGINSYMMPKPSLFETAGMKKSRIGGIR